MDSSLSIFWVNYPFSESIMTWDHNYQLRKWIVNSPKNARQAAPRSKTIALDAAGIKSRWVQWGISKKWISWGVPPHFRTPPNGHFSGIHRLHHEIFWASCKFHPMEEPRILLSNMVMSIVPGLRGQRTTPKVVIDSFSTSSSIAMFASKWSTRECENKRKPNHLPHSPLSILKNFAFLYIYINP